MKSGNFVEELDRMNDIANHIKSNAILLFNESFAATNGGEGSQIAQQIVQVLLKKILKISSLPTLYEFTHNFYDIKK